MLVLENRHAVGAGLAPPGFLADPRALGVIPKNATKDQTQPARQSGWSPLVYPSLEGPLATSCLSPDVPTLRRPNVPTIFALATALHNRWSAMWIKARPHARQSPRRQRPRDPFPRYLRTAGATVYLLILFFLQYAESNHSASPLGPLLVLQRPQHRATFDTFGYFSE